MIDRFFLQALAVITGVAIILSLEPLMKLVSDYGIKSYEQIMHSAGVETQVFSFSLLIKIVISCLYYFVRKRSTINIEEAKRLRFLNYINIVSCFVSIGAGYFSLLSRLNLYFSVTSVVLLSNLIQHIRLDKKLLKIGICVLFFVYFVLALPGKDTVPWIAFFNEN
jgi:membrane-associated HD superfamily phosphohydrolase